MMRISRPYWIIAVITVGFTSISSIAAPSPTVSITELPNQAWELAQDGRLGEVLDLLKALPVEAQADPQVASLREELQNHEQHEQRRSEKSRQLFQAKIDALKVAIGEGDVDEAMTDAVEASGLAEDLDVFLITPEVVTLTELAEAKAAEAEETGQWVKALTLYRGLKLLHQDATEYDDHLTRIARHVQMLRMYAPQILIEQYEAARKAADSTEGEEKLPPLNIEEDQWHRQLEGVSLGMLREALALAARQHVEPSNFEKLIASGVEGLIALVETKGVETTFPTLADEQKVAQFRAHLDELHERVKSPERRMSYLQAGSALRDLLKKNQETLQLPEEVVIYEFGNAAMSSLDDFSNMIWPSQKSQFERTTEGHFSGVGIQITLEDGQLTVISPLEDTPAHKAGIKAGDQVVTIDGQSTTGISLDQAVDKITGPTGTKVVLGVHRPSNDETYDVTLERSRIRLVSVKGWDRKSEGGWDYYIDPNLRIGYVRMTQFGPDTADELDAAIEQMKSEGGISGLILDLRFNPGGLLTAAVGVSNRFVDSGVIVSTEGPLSFRPWRAMADRRYTQEGFPLVVLINEGSASASEIVAGCLQDHERALIVGQRSYGKGSVQNLFPISSSEAYLKLTTQYYKLPEGRIIHRRPGAKEWGIDPDIEVKMTSHQMADLLEARMSLDVLRDPDDLDQETLQMPVTDDEDAQSDKPQVNSVDDILATGLDPQLETGLLLLKTRLLGEMIGSDTARLN